MYSGYELFEHQAVKPGSEEYLDSEKYELRPRDFEGALRRGDSLEDYIGPVSYTHLDVYKRQLLITMTFLAVCIPEMCWIAPEIPKPMYRSGDTVTPVCPT